MSDYFFTEDDLLSLTLDTQEIEVPGSDKKLCIKALSADEVAHANKYFGAAMKDGQIINADSLKQWHLYVFQRGVINPETKAPLLTAAQVRQVAEQKFSLISYMAGKIIELSSPNKRDILDFEKN